MEAVCIPSTCSMLYEKARLIALYFTCQIKLMLKYSEWKSSERLLDESFDTEDEDLKERATVGGIITANDYKLPL